MDFGCLTFSFLFFLWSISQLTAFFFVKMSVIISPESEALWKVALVGGCDLWSAAGPSRDRKVKLNVMLISR